MESNKFNSWVEKYRPKTLEDITAQKDVIDSLKKTLITKNLPHLIFFGPSGCGKTSTILALSKELFGEENYYDRVIELNASDERGINVVREKIKTYAKKSINPKPGIPPWKIIILDEADNMTSDSQFALRRIMEEYSKLTRFCIICNYHNKIIDPINSRCALFRFKPIKEDEIIDKLKFICEKENFECSEIFLKKIIKNCRGDLRKAINFLQKCYNTSGNILNQDILNEISGVIPKNVFDDLVKAIIEKNSDVIDFNIKNEIVNNGYSLVNQILHFHNYILNNENFSSKIKSLLSLKLTEIDNNLIKGGDEFIEFMRLAYDFSKIINSN
jgi:replication factor C subunit 2/4